MRTINQLIMPFLICLFLFSAVILPQQPAFPGAEGAGRFATGGRGGTVYEVTNLNNSGAGSIVDAVSQPNRTIVFRISGTILLNGVILQPKSNTTIAGQTAPGDGITIKGRFVIGNVQNVIIRYLRVRVDEGAANSSGDAIDIDKGRNILIDHVTASYSRDEGISCQPESDFVTVQWCLISEALTFESHSYGSLIRGDFGDQKSYHHNLYAHNNNRLPRPGNYTAPPIDTLGLFFDFRNNVIYNWKGSEPGYNADVNMISRYNMIGNSYVSGVESNVTNRIFKEDAIPAYGYFLDNEYNGNVPADPYSQVSFNGFTSAQIAAYKARAYVLPMAPVTTTSPAVAREQVLAMAGASIPKRDIIDLRIINDVKNKTGHSIVNTAAQPEGGWPPLNSLPAPLDSDHDGMPDAWELANGLNPNNDADRNIIGAGGYTNLELYLNSLVQANVTTAQEFHTEMPTSCKLEQNYPNPFNPTTMISFQINQSGNVKLAVYDMLGNEVQTLVEQSMPAGRYSVPFNGSHISSGIYFYTLRTDSYSTTKKLLLVK